MQTIQTLVATSQQEFKRLGKLINVEMTPKNNIVWRTKELKEKFEPILNRISRAYYQAEIEMVARGHRLATVATVSSHAFENDISNFLEKGLIFKPIQRVKAYGGFAHKHEGAQPGDPNSFVYGVIAKDFEVLEAFYSHNSITGKTDTTSHTDIGTFLGYPQCCREFFDHEWIEQRWVDTIYQQALNTGGAELIADYTVKTGGHGFCNQALRYFGIRISPQLCHSWDCEATIEWAQLWYDIMYELDPEAAEWALILSEMPITWSALKGVAIVKTPIFVGTANTAPCFPEHKVIYQATNPILYTPEKLKV